MEKTQLFGTGISAISPNISAQHRVNCYFEIVQTGEKEVIAIRGTPGLTLWTTLPKYPIRGWVQAGNYLYVCADSAVYQVSNNGGYTQVFSVTSATNPVSMAINESQIILIDGQLSAYVFPYYSAVNSTNGTIIAALVADVASLTTITQALGFQ